MDPATHAYAHWNRWEQTQRQGKGAREENAKQHQIEMAGGGDTETERHQERSSKRWGRREEPTRETETKEEEIKKTRFQTGQTESNFEDRLRGREKDTQRDGAQVVA